MKTQFLTILVLLLASCSKPEPEPKPELVKTIPTLTASIGTVTDNSIAANGNVTSDGNASVTERGFYISTVAGEHTESATCTKLIIGSGTGSFSNNFTGLISNTNYYITAYATNEKGTTFATELNRKTNFKHPEFQDFTVTNIGRLVATFSYNLVSFAGSVPVEMGVNIYTTNTNGQPNATPVTGLSVQISSSTPGTVNFQSSYNGGSPGKLMFAKAYAKFSDGSIYNGSEAFFTHTGYYLGQNIGTGKVVMVWNEGGNAKLMANQPVKNPTLPGTLGRPSYGFENLWVGATSENGLTNTNMLAAVNSSAPYGQPGYVDPYGAFKLAVAYTMSGVSSDFYIPTKADWEQIWANRVTIFGVQQNWSNFFQTSTFYTSTEIDANHYSTFRADFNTNLGFISLYKMAYTDGNLKPAAFVVCDLPPVVN